MDHLSMVCRNDTLTVKSCYIKIVNYALVLSWVFSPVLLFCRENYFLIFGGRENEESFFNRKKLRHLST